MPPKSRFSLLSLFLLAVAVAVVAAVVVRVRAYSSRRQEATVSANPRSAAPGQEHGAPVGPGIASGYGSESTEGSIAAGRTASDATTQAPGSSRPSAREQKFRELLALGASKPAGVAAQAPQPFVRTPVLSVPAARPQVVRPNQPAPAPVSVRPVERGTAATPQPGSGGTKGSNPKEEKPDPNSDTVPPQLISLEFNPPRINDGGETTLTIVASDDLSGVRAISGTLTSPTGKAIQSFSQQREGETNRYLSRITIPKDAEEGTWKISFLTMTDNATNMATLSYAQGTIPPNAVLRVTSSRSDSVAPTVRNVWIAKRAMRSGEPNTLFVDAEDDKSGVRLVAAVFVSPSKIARIGVGCKRGEGEVWECPIAPPTCLDCGEWALEQLQLQDNANNYATIRQDNPLVRDVRVSITGETCDHTPPVLQAVSVDKPSITIGRDEPVVAITLTVTDDLCGVGGVSGHAVGPGTNAGTSFAFSPQGDSTTWIGYVRLTPNVPRGIWHLQSVTVNDKGQNVRIYYETDALLQRATFQVR